MEQNTTPQATESPQIDAGTYEILKQRLKQSGNTLQEKLNQLNEVRKDTFGNIPTTLLKTERISTENNCVPRDMIAVGDHFIFGYNVHIGLKSEVEISDVFSVYQFRSDDDSFHAKDLSLLSDERFAEDFRQLYKYYKHTTFSKFVVIGPHLFLKFQTSKDTSSVKAFKFLVEGEKLTYLDNRSDHEIKYPAQHEFEWKRASRDHHREGQHPHISIMDKVFVETIGGDLTIKIEDNTDSGEGIYAEEVSQPEQTLDDAEIYFADLGNLILLKIKPYMEEHFRFFVFNYKLGEVHRIDSIKDACVLLPDEQGIIYSQGYYLQTGELKIYDESLTGMRFEKKNISPNGEDFQYVFYNPAEGDYVLLSYNRIEQTVESPVICSGYSFFRNGELVYFKADHEPKKHHALQLWQTPYVHPDYEVPTQNESYLYKVGNKDIVRAMAECNELLKLIQKEEAYTTLYQDVAKKSSEIGDSYYWIGHEEAFQIDTVLQEIHQNSVVAIEEFEKVRRIKKATLEAVGKVSKEAKELVDKVRRRQYKEINDFVETLANIRSIRGETISLKELRYADIPAIEELEKQLAERNEEVSQKCVAFLLEENSLLPYEQKVAGQKDKIDAVSKVAEADQVQQENDQIGQELEMLIEIVSNLKIDDATQTTAIIDNISDIYASLNQVKAKLKQVRKNLLGTEAKAEFAAQLRLISQSVVNYLDVSDTPQRCEEYMTRLMVQLEELEGKFADFDEFIPQLADKRDEVYQAFESKKLSLTEQRNKKATSLQSAADRILKSIEHKVKSFKEVSEINAYFAADIMVHKVQEMITQLQSLDDNVKADDLQSKLNSTKEEAVRQLKDRQDLFADGENVITLGKHKFSVNVQSLDVSLVQRDGDLYYHLSGTNFFEKADLSGNHFQPAIMVQDIVSENSDVYRAEYLAYQYLKQIKRDKALSEQAGLPVKELASKIQTYMAPRYQEGYQKGVHDADAAILLQKLIDLESRIDLLRFMPDVRACAALWWQMFAEDLKEGDNSKALLLHRIRGQAVIRKLFPNSEDQQQLIDDLATEITAFVESSGLFTASIAKQAASYLTLELAENDIFTISREAAFICEGFTKDLKDKDAEATYKHSVASLKDIPEDAFTLICDWLKAWLQGQTFDGISNVATSINEAAVLLFTNSFDNANVLNVEVEQAIEGLSGEHNSIEKGSYTLNYHNFMQRLSKFENKVVPAYTKFQELKKSMVDKFRQQIRLDEFKPRVLSSFVRNQLVDQVYLPLIGDNLAKQIGVVGHNKRTDLMGMLLLISPPGYGKTTLMEYIANRIGLIFMKINGPAIGHQVTSLDPDDAGNASAREELKKLNLAFEMGDNVMVYLDDIQHCNPEFLQKFISLCDGQRKIEGVYKGVPQTYDLRGKRVCVVMAGNPYTESGEKFRIPDMLANRADTYNLGDIIGDTESQFRLSYIENALTSNPVLTKLAVRSRKDIHTVIRYAETGNREGLDFEANMDSDELNEYVSVLSKLLKIRDAILKVNLKYIESAAQADEYRTEPAFKLQGSYRNMNKLAEKVMPVMNEKELQTLVLSHYENESQTLTSGAEANMLIFKGMMNWLDEVAHNRWEEIKKVFMKNQKQKGYGSNNQMAALLEQLEYFTENLKGIKEAIEKK
ncbi:DNA repair ATPase [Chondrinema litorale]|uniref:DNA repair ATPase n=1 Tax=Chondrinema litorale TaxID=2994555 RepID=UPI002543DA8B|nr:DNA repair ATPase [Chondrinema litorale]UZR95278.1 DNA repair ATPase [Chondrinema litorale]